MRRRPAVIDNEDDRACRGEPRLRIEQWAGERENHQSGERHAQKDQP